VEAARIGHRPLKGPSVALGKHGAGDQKSPRWSAAGRVPFARGTTPQGVKLMWRRAALHPPGIAPGTAQGTTAYPAPVNNTGGGACPQGGHT